MTAPDKQPDVILLAEDDDDHYLLIQNAFKGTQLKETLFRVVNGVDLMQYLLNQGIYSDVQEYRRPRMVILDLNLPKKDGREVLREIRANPNLADIPISILTTSNNEDDRIKSFDLGAQFFIKKPIFFKEYVEIIKKLKEFWSNKLPDPEPTAPKA